MIVNFLHIHRHLYSIERMCHVFNEHEYDISPATYYTVTSAGLTPTQAELEEAYAAHKLYTLWVKARRVYVAGANSGKYSCALDGGLAVTRYND